MIDSSSSPRVGISSALQGSPARSTRSSREDNGSTSESLLPIRMSPGPMAAQLAFSRGPSRARWLVLRLCFVLFAVASCMVLVTDARQSKWFSNVLRAGSNSQSTQAPASAFQASSSRPERAGAPDGALHDALAAAAFQQGSVLDLDPEAYRQKTGGGVPRVLHQVFMDGEAEYNRLAGEQGSGFKREWRDYCIGNHSDWTYMFWDREAAEIFLETHYPWFISTFKSYPKTVQQGDALRPFLMHAFGGLYIDLDVQCFRSAEPSLLGHDIVLQSEYHEGRDIVNSIMASVPGHPFWKAVITEMLEKWHHAHGKVDTDVILDSGGPRLYGNVFQKWTAGGLKTPAFVGAHNVHGSRIAVYGLGSWFVPCMFEDAACHALMAQDVQQGRLREDLVGYHQYSGSWLAGIPKGK